MTAHTYDLYLGGGRTTNPDTRMFPSAEFNPLDLIKSSAHKTPVGYALTRVLNPGPQAPVTVNGAVADQAITNFLNFQALTAPVVATDILTLVPLPNGSIFDGFYWEVETPLAGFTFSIGFARIGNSSYTTGDNTIPDGTIGTILLATQSGATRASGFVDAGGNAMTADTPQALESVWIGGTIDADTGAPPPSDALCLRIDALATVATGAANFANLRLKVSPLIRELVRGQW
jgi:hypothetical protein